MSDQTIIFDRSNVGPGKRPVLVKQVDVYTQDKEGRWKLDQRPGILQNPDGR